MLDESILRIGHRILKAHVSRQMSMGPTLGTLATEFQRHIISATCYFPRTTTDSTSLLRDLSDALVNQ